MLIYSSSNQIKNISFTGFDWNGLTLIYADATNNTISGCWLGVDSTGTNAAPNAYQGILIASGASGNIVGGTSALGRNVLSGNSQYGIFITDSNTTGNTVLGNYIGTGTGGSNALANGLSGIFIGNGASGNIVGGTSAPARNVLSGNSQYGVIITSNTTGNVVFGNFIGTDAGGSLMVSNAFGGVFLADGASLNIIGGTNAGGGNVISGNPGNGILIRGSNVVNNTVQGNFIGTDATGMNPLPNTVAGVTIDTGSSSNLIGGTVAGARNVISGNILNYDYGVIIAGLGTSGNVVEGNYIGLGVNGLTAVPNYFGMVCSAGATNNTFGGTVAGARNVISGNSSEGLRLTDAGTTANVIQGNFIGTDLTGQNAVPNGFAGLTIYSGATSNLVGGTSASARNIISGNDTYGVVVANAGTSGNLIEGNYIGPGSNGVSAVPNSSGILFSAGATNNTLGGTNAAAANLISGNGSYGVFLSDPGTSGNFVLGNLIGTDVTGTNALGNGTASYYGANVELQSAASGNFIGGVTPGARNIIAFSSVKGVLLFGASTTNDAIRGNFIFGNTNLGIDLGNVGITLNHTGFLAGPNDLQNYPVITNAFSYATSTIVSGTLNSLTNQTYFIDFYRNYAPDPSGNFEGQFYVGTVSVTTDGSGDATFAYTNTSGNYAGQYFTTTATSPGGDTSEFGLAVLAANAPVPPQFIGLFSLTGTGFNAQISLTIGQSYHVQATTNLANPGSWVNLTNFTATSTLFPFTDSSTTNYRARFYRVVSP
jgi:titin